MIEWDVSIFIEALEEAFPLNERDRHLGIGHRWLEVVCRLQTKIQVLNHDVAALRSTLIAELNNAVHTIGDIPTETLYEILKMLRRCFTCNENPHRNTQSNREFPKRLDENIDKDKVYKADPSLGGYLLEWKRDHQREILQTNGSSNQMLPTNKQGGKQVHNDTAGGKSQATTSNTIDGCEGCGRRGHLRSNCIYKTHPDFNHTGLWRECKAFEDCIYLRVKGRRVDFPFSH